MFQKLENFPFFSFLFFLLDFEGLVKDNNRCQLHLLLSSTKANEVVKDQWNSTHLCYVVRHDRLEMFKWLVNEGVHVYDNYDEVGNGTTIAHEASMNGSNNCLHEICEHHNFLIHLKDSFGRTSLYSAVWYNHLNSVKMLIRHGADPNVTDNRSRTPLDWAKVHKHEEIIKEFEKVSSFMLLLILLVVIVDSYLIISLQVGRKEMKLKGSCVFVYTFSVYK